MNGYTPSDGTLHRFTQDNLNDARYALEMAKRKYGSNRSSYLGGAVVDSNPRHNKTSETTISMNNYDQNNANAVVVIGTTSNDNFKNRGYSSFIWGDSGKDTIDNHNSDVTISGGADNDSILIRLDNFALERNSLSGGSGNDTIDVLGNFTKNPNNITIMGGKDDDRINLPARSKGGTYHLQYKDGDGDDTVVGWYKFDTLYIEGSYSTEKTGNGDIIVNIGSGSIFFKDPVLDYTGQIKIQTVPAGTFGSSTTNGGNDTTSGGGGTSTLSSGKNINNNTSGKKLSGTSYADTIYNGMSGSKVTISTGDGKDTITNFGDTVKIDTGAGNDSIYSYSYYGTIIGGTGNDTISLSSSGHHNVIQYASGDGNDVIYNLGSTDTLSITSGTYSSQVSGSDVLVKVGSSTVTIKGGKDKTLNVKGTKAASTVTTVNLTDSNSSSFTADSSVKTINASSRTTAIKIVGNALANTISGGSKNDSLYGAAGNDSLVGNAGNDYLSGGDGKDTLGGDAGNDKLYGGEGDDKLGGGAGDDTLVGGKGNDSLYGGAGNDLFVYNADDGKDFIIGFDNTDTLQIKDTFSTSYDTSKKELYFKVGSTANAITIKNFQATVFNINDSEYKISGNKLALNEKNLTLKDSDASAATLGSNCQTAEASSRTKAIKITGNALANTISGGSKNDSLYGAAGNDSLVGNAGNDYLSGGDGKDTLGGDAGNDKLYGGEGDDKIGGGAGDDTLVGGKGNDSLWGGAGNDLFVYNADDGKDFIIGFDNTDMLQIKDTFSASYNTSKKEIYFDVGSTSNAITIKNFGSTSNFNINGYSYKINGSKLALNSKPKFSGIS